MASRDFEGRINWILIKSLFAIFTIDLLSKHMYEMNCEMN